MGIAWFGIVQCNNLKALYLAMTSDTETLKQKQEEQDKKREDLLQQYGLTKPDINQIEGENTEDNLSDPSVSPENGNNSSSEGDAQSTQTPSSESPSTPEPSQGSDQSSNQMQAQLQEYVTQLYLVEAKYQESLNEMVEATKREFWSLPHDQQNAENKMRIVRSKLDVLIAQENACDAEVEAILADMQALLEQHGQSTELVNEIRSYYQESKANWKAEKMTELYK